MTMSTPSSLEGEFGLEFKRSCAEADGTPPTMSLGEAVSLISRFALLHNVFIGQQHMMQIQAQLHKNPDISLTEHEALELFSTLCTLADRDDSPALDDKPGHSPAPVPPSDPLPGPELLALVPEPIAMGPRPWSSKLPKRKSLIRKINERRAAEPTAEIIDQSFVPASGLTKAEVPSEPNIPRDDADRELPLLQIDKLEQEHASREHPSRDHVTKDEEIRNLKAQLRSHRKQLEEKDYLIKAHDQQLEALLQTNGDLRAEVATARKTIAELKSSESKLSEYVHKLESDLDASVGQKKKPSPIKQRLALLEDENRQLKNTLSDHQRDSAETISAKEEIISELQALLETYTMRMQESPIQPEELPSMLVQTILDTHETLDLPDSVTLGNAVPPTKCTDTPGIQPSHVATCDIETQTALEVDEDFSDIHIHHKLEQQLRNQESLASLLKRENEELQSQLTQVNLLLKDNQVQLKLFQHNERELVQWIEMQKKDVLELTHQIAGIEKGMEAEIRKVQTLAQIQRDRHGHPQPSEMLLEQDSSTDSVPKIPGRWSSRASVSETLCSSPDHESPGSQTKGVPLGGLKLHSETLSGPWTLAIALVALIFLGLVVTAGLHPADGLIGRTLSVLLPTVPNPIT
ncbi:uncharacterized protein BJ171DRAFT_499599 [Polychytrium aggregatum]|uniref:uncharacterized protein n=1 Tax=Polychytrium aggregatum TaxID=110093 RepID=UPI0022FDD7D8|nr:uncharacterized protein BJ171DRAFT_499599 [Polychytrium aggregatum]KAI9205786.1 hypothetical protein BJ171DRAFT_499599 [Polychytrium aggregatum]